MNASYLKPDPYFKVWKVILLFLNRSFINCLLFKRSLGDTFKMTNIVQNSLAQFYSQTADGNAAIFRKPRQAIIRKYFSLWYKDIFRNLSWGRCYLQNQWREDIFRIGHHKLSLEIYFWQGMKGDTLSSEKLVSYFSCKPSERLCVFSELEY